MKNKTLFILYVALLAAAAPFSTDIYLASMPIIQQQFHASSTDIQLTLSLFFVCFAVGQLFWGALSDKIGRKPVVYVGISLYVIGSVMCILSQDIHALILARVVQGSGACAGIVCAMSMVKDSFEDPSEMAKVLGGMVSVMLLAPMVAPVIGSRLLTHFSWHSNFYFLAGYGLVVLLATLFVKESYPAAIRKPLPVSHLLSAYYQQLKFPPFLLASLSAAFMFCIVFCFISSASFVYINLYHVAAEDFGFYFALNASALILGSLTLRFFKDYMTDKIIVISGLALALSGAAGMWLALHVFPAHVYAVVIPAFFATYGVGLLFPELTSFALRHVVEYTGLASSLIGTFRFVFAAVTGLLVGTAVTHSALPMAGSMIGLGLVTALFLLFYFKCLKSNAG